MTSPWALMCLLGAVWWSECVGAFRIISQESNVEIVGQSTRVVHAATVQCSESDAGVPQTLQLKDSSGTTRTVTFECERPRYVYSNDRIGYVPRVQYPVYGRACLLPGDYNSSELLNDDGVHSAGLPPRRRLLSEQRSESHVMRLYSHDRRLLITDTEEKGLGVVAGGLLLGGIAGALGPAGVLVGAAAGGGLAGSLFNMFDGGGGDTAALKKLQHIMKGLGNTMNIVTGELAGLDRWKGHMMNFEQSVLQSFNEQASENAIIQSEVSLNRNAIDTLEGQVAGLANASNYLEEYTTRSFRALDLYVAGLAGNEEAIWNATKKLHLATETELKRLIATTSWINREMRLMDATTLRMYRRVQMRRMLIKLFWATLDQATPQASVPFLNYTGKRPKSDTEQQAMRTFRNARRLSSVIMQRTYNSGGGKTAQLVNVTYVCDPFFLLTNFASYMTFQALFDSLGPPGCYSGNPDAPWTCQCVVRVDIKTCSVNTRGRLYPWDWEQVLDLPAHDQPNSWCDSTVSVDSAENNLHHVFDSTQRLYDFIRGKCDGSDGLPIVPSTGSPAYKVRLFGSHWSQFTNLTLDSAAAGSDVCQTNYAISSTDDAANIQMYMAYNIYRLWQMSYGAVAQIELPKLEEEIFGKIASDLTYQETPFNTDARTEQTYHCTTFQYAKVASGADPKIPSYATFFNRIQKEMAVRVDGQLVQNSTSGSSSSSTAALQSLSSPGNTTVTTNLQLNADATLLLPSVFQRLGSADFTGVDPVTYDVPLSEMCSGGNPAARQGCINYLFESSNRSGVTPTSPLTLDQWQYAYNKQFDAGALGADPTVYKAKITPLAIQNGLVRAQCSSSYNADGSEMGALRGKNQWCAILDNFDIKAVGADESTLEFYPRSYTYEATVRVPGGTFVQHVLSVCPDASEVIVVGGTSSVRVNSSSPEPVTLRARVTKASDPSDTDCLLLDQDIQLSLNHPYTSPTFTNVQSNCLPLAFNLYPVAGSPVGTGACYAAPGLLMETSHVIEGGMGVPGVVQHAIATASDRTVMDLAKQIAATSATTWELMQMRFETGLSDAQIESKVDQALAQQLEALYQLNQTTTFHHQGDFEREVKKVIAAGAKVKKDITEGRTLALEVAAINAKIEANNRNLTQIWKLLLNDSQYIDDEQALLEKQNAQLQKAIAEFVAMHIGDGSGGSGCSAGFLSSLICPIEDLFRGLFSNLLSMLIHILVLVLFAELMLFAVKELIHFGMEKGCKCSKADPDEGESDEGHETGGETAGLLQMSPVKWETGRIEPDRFVG